MLHHPSRRLTVAYSTLACLASALLLTSACGKSGSSDALQPGMPQGGQESAQLGDQVWVNQGVAEYALGIYSLRVDPEALTASIAAEELRAGSANDDLYLLSIDSFLSPSSFVLNSVTGTSDTVDIGYTVTHPFPAPNNPAGTPNGSTNRADLGVSGMVLFLATVPTATGTTYFANRTANTALVANADAYYCPGGLLVTGGVANTFPFRQLVDETVNGTGSRVGIGNAGNVTGNYGADGWTRTEFGAANKSWTGYGVLHQGQASSNVVSLNKSALAIGFSMNIGIIAKYNDPRGGTTGAQKKVNRLPPAAPDSTKFAYRMPHGALDGAHIEFLGESGGFVANTISASTLRVKVEDWDARATESTLTDLSLDPTIKNVAIGEAGVPLVEVCIPGVLGDFSATAEIDTVVDDDTAVGGDAGVDTGQPGDALFYEALVTKNAGASQVDGTFTGMVRVTDPETGQVIGLNESLAPLATPPAPVTYQVCSVSLGGQNTSPTASYSITQSRISSGSTATIDITGVTDPESDSIAVEVDWTNDGTWIPAGNITAPYPVSTQVTSPVFYTFSGEAPDIRSIPVRIDDGFGWVDLLPVATTEIVAPAPPFLNYNIPLPGCILGFTDVHVATDIDQRPVLIYHDSCTDMLMVARANSSNPDAPGAWPAGNIYPIDPATGKGRYSSIVMNNSVLPTVSYYDSTNGNLKVAIAKLRRPVATADWTRMTVESPQDTGTDTALILLPTGRLGVAYHRVTDGDLRVAFTSRNNPALSTDWPAAQRYTLSEGALPIGNAGLFNSVAMVNGRASILSIETDLIGSHIYLRQAAPLLPPDLFPAPGSWTTVELTRTPGSGPPTASQIDITEANNGFGAFFQVAAVHKAFVSPTGAPGTFLELFDGQLGDLTGSGIAAVGECPTMHVVMDNDSTGGLTVMRADTFPPSSPSTSTWTSTDLAPGGQSIDCGCLAGKLFVVRVSGRNLAASMASDVW